MKTVFLFMVCLFQFQVHAQGLYLIKGRLVDEANSDPIPYAHIAILGTNQGTVSNDKGEFVLRNLPDQKVSIKVSSIGYESDTIEWSPNNGETELFIRLTQGIVELIDVRISGKRATPEEIIEEAFSRISQNYWLDEHLLTGYFKETENTDGKPLYIAEAIIQAKIPGEGSDADERIKIIHLADRRKDVTDHTEMKIDYRRGGAYRCLKNSINDPINPVYPSQFENYSYKIDGYTTFNGKEVVIISFTDSKRKPIYGKLIIDLDSYAFVRMEGTKTHGDGSPLDRWKWTSHTWIEQYMEDENGKWLLNSSIYIGDWIKKRSMFYWIGINKNQKFQTRSYYFTTDYSGSSEFTEEGKKFSRGEEFYHRKYNDDEKFWSSFNYLIPNETEEKISNKVENQ